MYIQPTSHLYIITAVPIDPDYHDTLWWDSPGAQADYFIGRAKYRFENFTYIRDGVVRVPIFNDNLYDCNYILFQNSSFSEKWFFAFITETRYINNGMSEITFKLDVLQTWHFDYTPTQCYIERQHTITDLVGENLVAENLELGEYVAKEWYEIIPSFYDYKIIMASTVNPSTLENVTGDEYGGVYSGVGYYQYKLNDTGISQLNSDIAALTEAGKSDSIVGLSCIIDVSGLSASANKQFVTSHFWDNPEISVFRLKNQIYSPRNKKLLTYPYNFIYITNLEGQSMALEPHLFNGEYRYQIISAPSVAPTIMLFPVNYNAGTGAFNRELFLSLSNFPQCSFSIDSYAAWLAQKGNSWNIDLSFSGLRTVSSAFQLNPSGVVSGAEHIAQLNAQKYEQSIQPPSARGNVASGDALFGARIKGFYECIKQIQPQFAKIIDDYFDMFGYAIHRIETPNRSSRPHWNYVKTVNCTIRANLNATDEREICAAYDNGVRFWKNPSEVHQYSLNNSPT